MIRATLFVLVSGVIASMLVAAAPPVQTSPPLPPGHPSTTPQLPQGHPPTSPQLPAGHPSVDDSAPFLPMESPTARPEDVKTPEATVAAYYDSISGPAGTARDWSRFRSLFWSEGRFITTREAGGRNFPIALSPDDFVMSNRRYFEGGGYFEREIHQRAETFGTIAQVFSTYESRRQETAEQPYSRGVNSFQLLFDGERWWIVTVIWDHELPKTKPIPEKYLPES